MNVFNRSLLCIVTLAVRYTYMLIIKQTYYINNLLVLFNFNINLRAASAIIRRNQILVSTLQILLSIIIFIFSVHF